MATAEETRAAQYRADVVARAAARRARAASLKGDPVALAALIAKTAPLIPDYPGSRP